MEQMPLSWDGSLLGKVKHKEINKSNSLWSFTVSERFIEATTKIDRFSLYCLFDESAPDFGFAKLGTTHIHIGKTSYTCVNFNFADVVPLVVNGSSPLVLRERVQMYTTLRWAFSVPVEPKKEIFFFEGRLYGKYNEIEVRNEGSPQEEWFPLTLNETRRKLLRGREFEKILRNISQRIERINRQAFPYLSIIRDRLSLLVS